MISTFPETLHQQQQINGWKIQKNGDSKEIKLSRLFDQESFLLVSSVDYFAMERNLITQQTDEQGVVVTGGSLSGVTMQPITTIL